MNPTKYPLQLHHAIVAFAMLVALFFFSAIDCFAAPLEETAQSGDMRAQGQPLRLKFDLALSADSDDCDDIASAPSTAVPTDKLAMLSLPEALASAAKVTLATTPSAAASSAVPPAPAASSSAQSSGDPSSAFWEIAPTDKTLSTALARWAASAGWQLLWDLPVDYAVAVHTRIDGSFADAVGLVAQSMANAEIPMKAIFYDGNHVLRIVPTGAE